MAVLRAWDIMYAVPALHSYDAHHSYGRETDRLLAVFAKKVEERQAKVGMRGVHRLHSSSAGGSRAADESANTSGQD